jgi:p-hydroxybenzoate 3-monooxygenase
VGIVGAGPAGLMLAHLLQQEGIESVVLEVRSRSYVEERVRAGVLEHGTVELMRQAGVSARLDKEGLRHEGIYLAFEGNRHRIDMTALTGKCITVYAQHELLKDLIVARLAGGGEILFEAAEVSIHDVDSTSPRIRFLCQGQLQELACDFVGGCDGFHGVCRSSIPAGAFFLYERNYPLAWLGILAEAAPASQELVYAHSERGFALFSMRTPQVTRLYLQCAPDEEIDSWPDERIWEELLLRFRTRDGWVPRQGPIVQKGISGMRSLVVEPMQYGRLLLAGDAAHIVPPTGAKGLNLAVADVLILARAIARFYRSGSTDLLESYSRTCLRRVWKVQRFSGWMTSLLHRLDSDSAFDRRRQIAELDYVTSSVAARTSLAENYVGLPFD